MPATHHSFLHRRESDARLGSVVEPADVLLRFVRPRAPVAYFLVTFLLLLLREAKRVRVADARGEY